MTLVVTHPYVSTITESTLSGGAGGLVGPTEWNQNHTLTGLASPAQGGTGITSGTGVTYFSSATVIADSGTLTANALVVGGGANGAPATLSSLGTTSTLLHGNASGNPSFGAVNLGSEVAGQLPVANGGTSLSSGQGILYFSGSSAISGSGTLTANSIIVGGGANGAPATSNIVTLATTDTILSRIAAGTLSVSQSTAASSPATLQVYNVIDSFTSPTNYERGILDWNVTANLLMIGTAAGGTGTLRNVALIGPFNASGTSTSITFSFDGNGATLKFDGSSAVTFKNSSGSAIYLNGISSVAIGGGLGIAATGTPASPDIGLFRVVSRVASFSDGVGTLNAGWMQWAGESRVAANSTTTSTALANVPGLAFLPRANRNYSFEAHLIFTDTAAGGIQCTVNATSTTTTYTLTFDGWVIDTTAVRGYAQGSAFGNVVASSLTTGNLGHVTITGTLMTSATAPSTVTIQFSQNTSNATPTTILVGSYMWAYDMP